jgi:hypothetical protein
MTDQRLRVAMWLTLPILIFCGVYSSLQARRVQQDTALLRAEVESLHSVVSRLQGGGVGAAMRATPSPRPTPPGERKAKTKAVERASKAKGQKAKAKGQKAKADGAEVDGETQDAAPRSAQGSPRKGNKAKGRRKKGKGKAP